MSSDTPETDAIEKAACDDTGSLCRPEILWDALECMERQRNEALQLALELRDALKEALPFIGATEAPRWVALDAIDAVTKATKLLP